MTLFPRSSGILLHPTSLPGRYGIGDLGKFAYQFVDYLTSIHQKIWQMLPLGPTSYGDSPYQCLSAFAGNPLLISFDRLVEDGWLTEANVAEVPAFPSHRVDFGWVIPYHEEILLRASKRFAETATLMQRSEYETWCEQQHYWLDDFALFMALKNAHGGVSWVEWDVKLAQRAPEALAEAKVTYAEALEHYKFCQWVFFQQWDALRNYAHDKGIRLFGDIPIFVAHDSSDVWANQSLFYLDEVGNPTVIAGVPPDYFSATGQRWGNPLYKWDVMAEDGYSWWIRRIRATLTLVDIMRIDHFRGFDAYWEVPASEPTAMIGQWVPGPGIKFFEVIQASLGKLPIIAEDLGVITPEVIALRDDLSLPGMKVLQFAWGGSGSENSFLPHNHVPNCVVYTGTHDNNTTVGWWLDPSETDDSVRNFMQQYLDRPIHEVNWEMIRVGQMSVAHTCVAPMQDILNLGADARMNTPGKPGDNWQWRMSEDDFHHGGKDRLAYLTHLYARA